MARGKAAITFFSESSATPVAFYAATVVEPIKAVRGYKASCRMAGRPSVVAPNRVQREFTVVKPNQVWVTDITYSAPGFQGG